MHRSHVFKGNVNRRRISRRRRASIAAAPSRRPQLKVSTFPVLTGLKRLYATIPAIRGQLLEAVRAMRSKVLGATASAAIHVSTFANRAYCKVALMFRLGRDYAVSLIAIASRLKRSVAHATARVWSMANREIELSDAEAKLRPFLQVATALFALVALLAAGFTAWHTLRGKPERAAPSVAQPRDHHPPLTMMANIEPSGDLESEFVFLPFGAEDEPAAAENEMLAEAEDIDAQDWFDDSFVIEASPAVDEAPVVRDEENLETAMSGLAPHAMPRPETPQKPLVTGIPIQPEPPFGMAPHQQSQPAWLANAVEPHQGGNGPMIAIVIDDAGVAQQRTRRATELPSPLTIAFIPYSNNLEAQTRYAHSRGHELLLHMPMEPSSAAVDPGYNALLTSLGQAEILRRLRWAMDRFDGYVGVNNHMGSKFMAQPELVRPVLEEISARGLLFLDSRTDHRTVGGELARDIGMPHATRNVFLDNDLDEEKIAAQLTQLEELARKHGQAIAIGHPHDVTVEVLARWIPEARKKGFRLVPVSAIVKTEYETELASAAGRSEANGLLRGAQ